MHHSALLERGRQEVELGRVSASRHLQLINSLALASLRTFLGEIKRLHSERKKMCQKCNPHNASSAFLDNFFAFFCFSALFLIHMF